MARDFSTSRFTSAEVEDEADSDPRIGLVNLADVMLVFACGLMLALVTYWNLDISTMQEMFQADEVTEVQDVEQITEDATSGAGGFVELGKVYQDPMTGKFYMLQEDLSETQSGVDSSNVDSNSDDFGSINQEDAGELNPEINNQGGETP